MLDRIACHEPRGGSPINLARLVEAGYVEVDAVAGGAALVTDAGVAARTAHLRRSEHSRRALRVIKEGR